ncbi:MAG TPA: UDP-glucose/GDP-mannose dehydrogenase family protein [Flavobacteriales bacterium]|nr:UDP-glucose/GDP-mannose dehydrogenase family protein [Flavobacteriales bacterium]
MNITVVGTGYVGIVTGTCLAETGNKVTCVDIDATKVAAYSSGKVQIYEPHLENLLVRNLEAGRIDFTTDLASAVAKSSIVFLALPTPPGENGSADLQYILKVAEDLSGILDKYTVIVDKSTVPVGTADKIREVISSKCDVEFDVVSNPEFLREGFAVDDFMKPDRVVVGCSSDRSRAVMEELYKPFVRQGNPVIFMDERSAELTKYAANAFLATKITFMNEVANYCKKVGADVDLVRRGIGTDSRIGPRFLFPGMGYGGSCFPKDVQALHRSGREVGSEFSILESVMAVNERQKIMMLPLMKDHFGGSLKGRKIAIWGLSFKPETDDIRQAPSLDMISALLDAGAKLTVYDPEAMDNVKKVLGDKLKYAQRSTEAIHGAEALLICTEWAAFRNPDFNAMKSSMMNPVIFDGRNLYECDKMKELGFTYHSVGREAVICT